MRKQKTFTVTVYTNDSEMSQAEFDNSTRVIALQTEMQLNESGRLRWNFEEQPGSTQKDVFVTNQE